MNLFLILLLILILIININKKPKIESFENKNNLNQIIIKQKIKKIKYNPENIINEFKNSKNSSLILLEIKNNNLIVREKKGINPKVHIKRINYITSIIKETLLNHKISDIIFIVSLRDNLPNLNIPYLGPVYEKGKSSIAIPNNWWSYFTKLDNRIFQPDNFDKVIQEYKDKGGNMNVKSNNMNVKSNNKKIVFRGSNNCDLRRKVKNLAKNKNFLDVELPKGKNDSTFIPNDKLVSEYQYYFVLRGRGRWTGSINQFSLANGVLFKVEEDSKQPIELFLEPEVDYISIKNDLSDFEEKVLLSKDKKLMEKMKNNLKRKSDIFFKSENIMYYMYLCITNLYQ